MYMETKSIVLEGAAFEKVKNELIAGINAFWKYNTLDLCILTFVQDPIVPNSVCPIFMYDPSQMASFSYICKTPTDTEDESTDPHFDPITASPPLVIFSNKFRMRTIVFAMFTTPHTTPIPICPSELKAKLNDGSITKLEVNLEEKKFTFFSMLGFPIIGCPIYMQLGYEVAIPFGEYALRGLMWKQHSVFLVLDMTNPGTAKQVLNKDESSKLLDDLKASGEVLLSCGIKVFPDFIKQKPLQMRVFSKENMDICKLSACLELEFKDLTVCAFYAYATGWS